MKTTLAEGAFWDGGTYLFSDDSLLVNMFPHKFIKVHDWSQRVWLNNQSVSFPFDLKETLKNNHYSFYIKLCLLFVIYRLKKRLEAEIIPLHNWLENRITPLILNKVQLNAYFTKLQGLETSQLSSLLGKDRLGYLDRNTRFVQILQKVLREKSRTASPTFFYPVANGVGSIVEELEKQCRVNNIHIIFQAEIKAILSLFSNNPVRIDYEKNQIRQTLEADQVISSIPLTELVSYCSAELAPDAVHVAGKLHYNDSYVVMFRINKPKLIHDLYVTYTFEKHHIWRRLTAISLPGNQTSVIVEFTTSDTSKIQPDALVAAVEEDIIQDLKLFERADILSRDIKCVKNTYPVYQLGFEQNTAYLENLFMDSQIHLVGRQGQFKYYNTSETMESTFTAIEKIRTLQESKK